MSDQDNNPSEKPLYSSPCFLEENQGCLDELQTHSEAMAWRRPLRAQLIEARLALSADERAAHTEVITRTLDEIFADLEGEIVATYWPFRGEPDLRPWMKTVIARGGACALPVVVEKAAPLQFRPWFPGCAMERGVWNIPIPAEGGPIQPSIVISPVVGFDSGCYRLGYGGGFYDRTLAAMEKRPRVLGVGYALQAIPTLHPRNHDIPFDAVLTENGIACQRSR